jgi:predicted negative regulator of RcsB-dependent stress response
VDLKIVEVVVLLVAGVLFVTWQFRDLRRAKEVTRQQREAEKYQAMQSSAKSDEVTSATRAESDPK